VLFLVLPPFTGTAAAQAPAETLTEATVPATLTEPDQLGRETPRMRWRVCRTLPPNTIIFALPTTFLALGSQQPPRN